MVENADTCGGSSRQVTAGAACFVRLARLDDADDLASIEWRASQHAYRGRVSERVLASHSEEAWARRWREVLPHGRLPIFVAVRRAGDGDSDASRCGGAIGFAWVRSVASEIAESAAELGGLYVLPRYHRRGVAGTLLERVESACQARGFEELRLWVLETNEEARAFYEASGFARTPATRSWKDPDGGTLRDVEYVRTVRR